MPGEVYSAEFRDRIRYLASTGFSRKEISTLLVVPESTISRITHEEMGLRPVEV
jgi:IS30 family transposase